jgi:hypothetical protein
MPMPNSSAAIWLSSDRLPWPISVLPESTMIDPSVSTRTCAVDIG